MRAILISDHPKWCALMMNGKKKIEDRKGTALYKATQKLIDEYGYAEFYVYNTRDEKYRLDKELNGKYFVWDTKSKDYPFDKTRNRHYFFGKVVFKFRCYKVEEIIQHWATLLETKSLECYELLRLSCLKYEELFDYLRGRKEPKGTAIHISDLEIFDKPKELCEVRRCSLGFNCEPSECLDCPHRRTAKAPQSFCYVEVE